MWLRFGLFCIAVCLSGCIDSSLTQCGDRLCPADSVCIEATQTCGSRMAVEACQGLSLGASCSSDAVADGICADYECRARGCGNGVVEGRELCDDGNTASHDGCAADCLSTETCGNGIVDDGEFCDCGSDAATKPASCASVNSDDLAAQCDTHCMRYCGDGTITGGEDCELGAALPSSCDALGYYRGALQCAPTCRFDVSQCSGVCGDGITEAAFGEECDLSAPAYSCAEIGFDYGGLSCNARCFGNVQTDCHRYGWRKIANDEINDFWTQGNRQLFFFGVDGVVESNAGQRTAHPALTQFARNTAFAVAASTTAVTVFGAAGDRTIELPTELRASVFSLAVTWAGEPAALDEQCRYWQHDAAGWSASTLVQRPAVNVAPVALTGCHQLVMTRNNGGFVASAAGLSYVAPGASGSTIEVVSRVKVAVVLSQPTAIGGVVVRSNDRGGTAASLHTDDPNAVQSLFSPAFGMTLQSFAMEESNQQRIVDIAMVTFESILHDSVVTSGGRNYSGGVPIAMSLFLSADGLLYGYGNGLWLADEFLGSTEVGWVGGPQDTTNWTDDHGALAISVNNNAFNHDFGALVQSLAAGELHRFVVAGGRLYRATNAAWAQELNAHADFQEVHVSHDGQVVAVAVSRFFVAANDAAAFQEIAFTLDPGCTLFNAFAEGNERFVVERCGSETAVLQLTTTGWQSVGRTAGAPSSVGQTLDGTLYVGTDAGTIYKYQANLWQLVAPPASGELNIFVAYNNELFALGRQGIVRYAHNIWGEMRNFATPTIFHPVRLAVTSSALILVGEPSFGPATTVELYRAPHW